MTATNAAVLAKAIAHAVRDKPSIIDELSELGLPAELLRHFVPPPQPVAPVDFAAAIEALIAATSALPAPEPPPQPAMTQASPQFSDQACLCWARMDNGAFCLAFVDPEPPEDA